MKTTYLLPTTGFQRSHWDEGFELFAVKLDRKNVDRLLGLVAEAGKLAGLDPEFEYLVLGDNQGKWLSPEDVPKDCLETIQEGQERDEDLDIEVEPIPARGNEPHRRRNLFVKKGGVFWGCCLCAFDGDDWLVDTAEISEAELRRISAALEEPEDAFR